MIGQGKKFEVWNEETWQSNQDAWLDDVRDDEAALPESLESLSL